MATAASGAAGLAYSTERRRRRKKREEEAELADRFFDELEPDSADAEACGRPAYPRGACRTEKTNMPISFNCPHCGRAFNAPEQLAGKRARCQSCGQIVTVPNASAVDDLWDWENNPPAQLPPALPVLPRRSTSKSDATRLIRIAAGVGGGALLLGLLLVGATLLTSRGPSDQAGSTNGDPSLAPTANAEPSVETAAISATGPGVTLTFSDRYDWRKVTCPEGGYSIMMPCQPVDHVLGSGSVRGFCKLATAKDRPGSSDVACSVTSGAS